MSKDEAYTIELNGPRTAAFQCNETANRSPGGFRQAAERWRSDFDLKPGDRSMHEMKVLTRALDLAVKEGIETRLADSFETALKLAEGLV